MEDLHRLAQKALKYSESLGINFADIRLEQFSTLRVEKENQKVEDISSGNGFGLGVRVLHKGKLGFFSTNNTDIKKAVDTALKLSKLNPSKDKVKFADVKPVKASINETGKKPVKNVSIDDTLKFLNKVEKDAKISPVLKSIELNQTNKHKNYLFASTEGSEISKQIGFTIMYVTFHAQKDGQMETTKFRAAAKDMTCYDRDNFTSELQGKARLAINLLKAKKAPAGTFNTILDPESTGVFAHEAIGHASEADLVIAHESIFRNKLGKKVGSEMVTIVDDKKASGDNWSYYRYDDEGVPAKKVELIKNGVVNTFLNDRETASKLNLPLSGNARSQSYAYSPLVRMSNTYVKPRDYDLDEMFKQLKDGYYLIGFTAGQVNTLSGEFNFASEYAFRVKNGERQELIKGCTFSGNILKTLNNVKAVQKDVKFNSFGFCGKGGQLVPVSDGRSHLLVNDLHIGGHK
jgi:TldD protein